MRRAAHKGRSVNSAGPRCSLKRLWATYRRFRPSISLLGTLRRVKEGAILEGPAVRIGITCLDAILPSRLRQRGMVARTIGRIVDGAYHPTAIAQDVGSGDVTADQVNAP